MAVLDSTLEAKIRTFLRTEIGVKDESITVDTPLVTTGLIDSAGLVRLAALLERETGRVIPDRDITAAHFDSIRKMDTYLSVKSGR